MNEWLSKQSDKDCTWLIKFIFSN